MGSIPLSASRSRGRTSREAQRDARATIGGRDLHPQEKGSWRTASLGEKVRYAEVLIERAPQYPDGCHDERPRPLSPDHQALIFQDRQCVAERRSTDAELTSEVRFAWEPSLTQERLALDGCTKVIGSAARQALGWCQGPECWMVSRHLVVGQVCVSRWRKSTASMARRADRPDVAWSGGMSEAIGGSVRAAAGTTDRPPDERPDRSFFAHSGRDDRSPRACDRYTH
jgi:hypothetical protein